MILTPDQRVRVFVSSTLEELAEERAAARRAIENLRLTPVMFELGARPHPPRDVYRTYLGQSDVFVGIYGESYGWVAPDEDVSGLEDEFRLSGSLPQLLYVKRPAPGRHPRLAAFVRRIEEEGDVSYRTFADASELGTLIEDDLALLLSERFAAPRAPRAALPAPLDTFVGRARELDELERLLGQSRLVTVTGPGGVGKTRLALEAARRVERRYRDGAQLILLAPVAQPGLVATTICERLGVPRGSAAAIAAAIELLRDAELLLVLDNFEHVLAAAPDVEHLLEGCPHLTVLVTSRSVLKLRGERELRIDPLSEADAVSLFVERSRAAAGVDESSITEICRRLEGIPLALELAAAQTRVLAPAVILERLSGPLSLIGAAGPAYPDRHRTVEAAVEWSFGLLDDEERMLCLRAGVFRGGFTLEALEAVAETAERSVLELLATLVESSLVHTESGSRYSMLETIRAYAVARLEQEGELAEARERHAAFFEQLLAESGDSLRSAEHASTLATLDAEADNIRAAFETLLERDQAERVVNAIWALLPYLTLRERLVEGRRWLVEARGRGAPSPRALIAEAALAFWASDYLTAASLVVEGREPAREAGDDEAGAHADVIIGVLETMRGAEHGIPLLKEARRRFQALGDEWGDVIATIGIAWGLNASEADAPLDLYETTLARARALGFEAETLAIGALGRRLVIFGQAAEAKRTLAEALRRTLTLRADVGSALYIDVLADLAAAEGEDGLAARLSAAAETGAEAAGAFLPPLSGNRAGRLRALRERMGDAAFEAEQEAGRATPLEDAAAEARAFARG